MYKRQDIDSYAGFDHKKLINKIKNLKLPLVVFRSKSGGAHLFYFGMLGCLTSNP